MMTYRRKSYETRRQRRESEPRDIKIAIRITKSQRDEIDRMCERLHVDLSAFIRMAARMAVDELDNYAIDVFDFIDEYGPIT